MPKWEYLELKITHGAVEVVDDEFVPPANPKTPDPYNYIKRMIADGWELVTRSGKLEREFTVVLKRLLDD
jgi:hypothetical protein